MTVEELTQLPKTDPTELFRYRDGLYAPELLGAVVTGLDFFTWLARFPATAVEICASLELAERPVDVMLTLFCAMGLIDRTGEVSRVTEIAREFLVRDSPGFLGPYYSSFADRPVACELLETLRSGKPVRWASRKEEKPWAQAMEGDAFAKKFTGAMDARGRYLGPALAQQLNLKGYRHLLDIAGGSGIYACCLVAANPILEATVFEKPPVDSIARQRIDQRGCAGRVDVAIGDMFSGALPAQCDVHLWSNALHDWDVSTVKILLGKSFAALPPGGMVVIHDAHLNREKTGPLSIAAYSVFLMAITEGKCYSIAEMESYMAETGFNSIEYRETAADHSVITARKPAS